jgi:hypothetical protein
MSENERFIKQQRNRIDSGHTHLMLVRRDC